MNEEKYQLLSTLRNTTLTHTVAEETSTSTEMESQ